MQANERSLIGSVFERNPPMHKSLVPSAKFQSSRATGFPAVQHRSHSAFSRAREIARNGKEGSLPRTQEVPTILHSRAIVDGFQPPVQESGEEAMRRQISEDNDRRIAGMTEEEIEEEKREIVERFGAGVGDLLRKVKEARGRGPGSRTKSFEQRTGAIHSDSGLEMHKDIESIPVVTKPNFQRAMSCDAIQQPHSILMRSSSRPPSRAGRTIRFATMTPEDVHVYKSAPASPKRKPLLLLPPDPLDNDIVSLGTFNHTASAKPFQPAPSIESAAESATEDVTMQVDPEEGTPEYIRRRFFPNVAANDPSVAWMQAPSSTTSSPSASLRFDLNGSPIPESISMALPTHLGLHHHADGEHAGYTLDEIFLLSRSSLPAQRASMLGVLSKIVRRLKPTKSSKVSTVAELQRQEEVLRKRILAAGLEAISERGSVGARAVEVVWECIVGWDDDVTTIEGIELQSPKIDVATNILQPNFFLAQAADGFAQMSLPAESLSQLLDIVHRLAQQSNSMTETIMAFKTLVPNIIQAFLLTPIPPTESSPLPDPSALQLLITLALASRSNASSLTEPADALLRFVTILPPSSPFPAPLSTFLLTLTLRFYAVLASYGMYAHIATTASTQFAAVGSYVLTEECRSESLMEAWTSLLEAWMICATDPHQTTPPHDILWSQVVGWGWADELMSLRRKLTVQEGQRKVWAGLWRAEAAWLEGARINGIKGGEAERAGILDVIRSSFEVAVEKDVISGTHIMMRSELDRLHPPLIWSDSDTAICLRNLGSHANVIASALRLWLAAVPSNADGHLDSPPFILPFSDLSGFSALLVNHPLWSIINDDNVAYYRVYCRPLTLMLSYFLQLSRRIPGTALDLWMAQAFSILRHLLPGDEENGLGILDSILVMITPDFLLDGGIQVPSPIWEKGGMSIIRPFLAYALRHNDDVYIGPLHMTPLSIKKSTTQRLTAPSTLPSTFDAKYGLPLSYSWVFTPVDHLLHSGASPVFKSLPSSWDASETEVVRVTLLLAKVMSSILRQYHLVEFIPSRAETVFACMRVFMLEHGQSQADNLEEVFRDDIVECFMDDLLAPYSLSSGTSIKLPGDREDLEKVATSFLGPSTPFYQFYTDFVALYDAISFSQPLFARLLFPPTSMSYATDYRKLLWADFNHLLKTVRTPVEQVITGNIGEYLWPVERDGPILSAYLKTLAKFPLDGFPRFVAVHHIACNIWPDLRGKEDEAKSDVDGNLVKAIVNLGNDAILKDVLAYRQCREGPYILPPSCYDEDLDLKNDRLLYVRKAWSEVYGKMMGHA